MSNQEQDAYFAGIAQARAMVYVKTTSRGRRRPMLEVMFRDSEAAYAMQEYFDAGKVTTETPRYRTDVRNYVYRVPGQAGLDIVERLLPYLQGETAEACRSALERCGRNAA